MQAHLRALPEMLYVNRKGPCIHPSGLYSRSLTKGLQSVRALTNTIHVEQRPEAINRESPAALSAVEAVFVRSTVMRTI